MTGDDTPRVTSDVTAATTTTSTTTQLEMGKNPNPARTNELEPRLCQEPNPNPNREVHVKMCKNLNRTEPYPVKNRTDLEPKCHGSYSVVSLNETVGTFTHFTVNEGFYLYLV